MAQLFGDADLAGAEPTGDRCFSEGGVGVEVAAGGQQ